MAKPKKKATVPMFKGDPCKTPSCAGHKAGYSYAMAGGGLPSPYSASFNAGMAAAFPMPKRVTANTTKTTKISLSNVVGAVGAAVVVAGAVAATNKPNNTP
jgi:hypothetical protein